MPSDAVTRVLDRLPARVRRAGDGYSTHCPAHDDRFASLSIGEGQDGRVLLNCHAGCTVEAIVAALGLTVQDLFDRQPSSPPSSTIVATYDYVDEHGTLLFQAVRFMPKGFRQRRPNGSGGWTWSLDGTRRVLYRLDRLHQVRPVFVLVVEGEKDVETLDRFTLSATTSPMGAGKWQDDYAAQLTSCGVQRVYVMPDNDVAGRLHAGQVALSCHHAGLEVRLVTLPGLAEKGDVSDWLAGGHPRAELVALAKAAPVWTPTSSQASGGSPLPFTTCATLMAEPDETNTWIVEDRFAAGSVNLVAGKPKAGKSTLMRALALNVDRGEPWLGHRCQPGHVVYVALEDKRSEVRRHFRRMGADGSESLRFLIGKAPDDLLPKLTQLLVDGDTIDLLIIDTAQRLLTIKDTNDYALVSAAFEPVLALARTRGVCIVLVHHLGKSDRQGIEGVLGSTAWTGSVDNVLTLNRTDRYRVLSSTQRIGPDLGETVVLLDEETGTVRFGGSRALVDLELIMTALVDAVRQAEPDSLDRATLLAEVEARRELKLKALKTLVETGRLVRTGHGHRYDPFRFALPREPWEPRDQKEPNDAKDRPTAQPIGFSSGPVVPPIGWEPHEDVCPVKPPAETATSSCGSQTRAGAEPEEDDPEKKHGRF